MRARSCRPESKRLGRVFLCLATGLLVHLAAGTESSAQQPWETAVGRACFEQWIADATRRLSSYPGDSEFNSRKPWYFNQYGLLVGRGAASNYAPDDWGKCGGDRYCYMWWLLDYTNGFGPRWPIWQAAGVPSLQPYVLACIRDAVQPIPPQPLPSPSGYTASPGYACYGGADYLPSWQAEANCVPYGCNFGRMDRAACLALGARKGARMVIHGNPGGGRDNECWLQNSCSDLRPNGAFTVYRSQGVPVPPAPTPYLSRGAFACYGGADYPATWRNEATCGAYGCYFGKLGLDACLLLGSQKGSREVIYGNPTGGRSMECWLQNACADLRPNGDFTLFRP